MAMNKERTSKKGLQGMVVSRVIALLLVLCLVECTSEQRINSRGKPSNLVDRTGWRTQRGGSCLSYGHSCWGAHGKRSGKPPSAAPDWYLSRLLRRMAANAELNGNQPQPQNDLNAIFQGLSGDDTPSTDKLADIDDGPLELPLSKNLEGKPMLDDDMLAKIKMWQIMRDSSDDK